MKCLCHACASVLFTITLCTPALADDGRLKVGFLSGGDGQNQFWDNMTHFAQAVAEDLDIDLVVDSMSNLKHKYNDKEKNAEFDLFKQLGSGDYFISSYIGELSLHLLQEAEKKNIRTFIINTDLLDRERELIGEPRGKYRDWIAHSYPDDVLAGYLAADAILARFPAEPSADDQPIVRMVGITGPFTVQASFDRNNGLKKRISKSENAMLYEIKDTDFSQAAGKKAAERFLVKYPSLNAIWTAGDDLAIGTIQALQANNRQPGKDVVVSGIDWTQRALDAVKSGDMAATVGGHFMEAGIALILIYDYEHGKDFAPELGTVIKTPMYVISKDNIGEYLRTIGKNPDWSKIDFRKFSKVYNKDQSRYDFSWARIMKNMQQ